jgi:hypothetical protein
MGRARLSAVPLRSYNKFRLSQLAEKLDIALDFGWRSGSPLR